MQGIYKQLFGVAGIDSRGFGSLWKWIFYSIRIWMCPENPINQVRCFGGIKIDLIDLKIDLIIDTLVNFNYNRFLGLLAA